MSLPSVSITIVPLVAAVSKYHREEPPITSEWIGSPCSVVELKLLIICEPNVPADTDGNDALCVVILPPPFRERDERAKPPPPLLKLANKSSSLSNEWESAAGPISRLAE